MPPDRLARAETWIFDLDNTLYHPDSGLLDLIDARIAGFIEEELGIGAEEADALRRLYFQAHGITLGGLVANHGVDPARFLEVTHEIDLAALAPDPVLAEAIAALPGRRIVHTNGSRAHAGRVLRALGLSHLFETVFALEDKALVPKPRPEAYARVLAASGTDPRRAAMIEDSARNLVEPARLGMGTIWLNHGRRAEHPEHVDLVVPDLGAFIRAVT